MHFSGCYPAGLRPSGEHTDIHQDTGPHRKVMDWSTRMKVAAGAARGLEYLHNKMTPPIIYRDLKCSNILLGDGYHPKLSDFGLAKVGPQGDKTHVSTRVMGTYGYCAPEYAMTGQLTYKSDIFSFGVVLLELITGRRAIDNRRPSPEQNLVSWARPLFKDRKKFHKMVDPALQGEFPIRGLYQALAIAAMCVQELPTLRPQTSDIVTALNYLASQTYDPQTTTQSRSSPSSRRTSRKDGDKKREEDESTSRKDGEQSKSEEDESTSRKDGEQIKSEEDESTSRKDGEQSKSEEDESINDPNTTQSRSSPSSRRTSRKEDVDQSKREEDRSTKSD
ncbi:hypothetical protein ACJIZ3_017954 [Penstemon smallii]|uniref:Protein kinase domain-containing protein n=1 Tax=Penstemon smallii TaxID=265156 RepID=A0ABD3SX26_9LAMI